MGPLTLGLQILSLNVNAPQPLSPIPPAGTFFQAPNPGPLRPFDWLRSKGDKKLAMLQQLHVPVLDLLSDHRMLSKSGCSTQTRCLPSCPPLAQQVGVCGTAKTALTTIYAEYPWNQLLCLYPGHGCQHGLYAELWKTQRIDTGQGRPPSL
jgi:hypothetical protein